MLEMIALHDEQEESVELFVSVDERDEIPGVRVGHHLYRERAGVGRRSA